MRSFRLVLTIISIICLMSCSQIQKAADVVTNPTAREVYERDFSSDDPKLLAFQKEYNKAKNDSIQITLPYTESGLYNKNSSAYSYNIQLQEGEKLFVELEKQVDSVVVLFEVFKLSNESSPIESLVTSYPNDNFITHKVNSYGMYKIIVQPEIEAVGYFNLKIYTQPVYDFPIAGGTNKDIKSFWADSRDGGRRSHEGIDIFAARGTPVVAITDGRISSVGNRGLGGKQVWLRDRDFGKTIYYAHLDSFVVTEGKRVKLGDTLGFVGNTGNAKTTAPHLHFGIYKGYKGPINPLPFVKQTEIPETPEPHDHLRAVIKRNGAELRKGPATGFEQYGSLKRTDTVVVLGQHNQWNHIVLNDSLKGFIHSSLLDPLPSN